MPVTTFTKAEAPMAPLVPDTFDAALRGMADRPFLESQHWQEQQWRADRLGAHPDVVKFEKLMVRRLAALGVPMFAHCVVRTAKAQTEAYVKGHSKAKPGQSPHQYGCAVDLIHARKGWELTARQWKLIGHIGKEIVASAGLDIVSLAWGGDWSFYDPAHWEVRGWQQLKGSYPWPNLSPTEAKWGVQTPQETAQQALARWLRT